MIHNFETIWDGSIFKDCEWPKNHIARTTLFFSTMTIPEQKKMRASIFRWHAVQALEQRPGLTTSANRLDLGIKRPDLANEDLGMQKQLEAKVRAMQELL